MVAAAVFSRDPFDGRRQVAIAGGDEVGELVDLFGRFRRRLDLDPAADAVEDCNGIEIVSEVTVIGQLLWMIPCHAPAPAGASIGTNKG